MMHFWSPVDQSIVSSGIHPCTEQCYRWEPGFYEMSEVIHESYWTPQSVEAEEPAPASDSSEISINGNSHCRS